MDGGKSIKLPYMEGIVNQIPTNGLHAGGGIGIPERQGEYC